MALSTEEFDLYIPLYRRKSRYLLLAGIAAVAIGAFLMVVGQLCAWQGIGSLGATAVGSTSLMPLTGFFTASQRARLLEGFKQSVGRGVAISPSTEAIVQRYFSEAA